MAKHDFTAKNNKNSISNIGGLQNTLPNSIGDGPSSTTFSQPSLQNINYDSLLNDRNARDACFENMLNFSEKKTQVRFFDKTFSSQAILDIFMTNNIAFYYVDNEHEIDNFVDSCCNAHNKPSVDINNRDNNFFCISKVVNNAKHYILNMLALKKCLVEMNELDMLKYIPEINHVKIYKKVDKNYFLFVFNGYKFYDLYNCKFIEKKKIHCPYYMKQKMLCFVLILQNLNYTLSEQDFVFVRTCKQNKLAETLQFVGFDNMIYLDHVEFKKRKHENFDFCADRFLKEPTTSHNIDNKSTNKIFERSEDVINNLSKCRVKKFKVLPITNYKNILTKNGTNADTDSVNATAGNDKLFEQKSFCNDKLFEQKSFCNDKLFEQKSFCDVDNANDDTFNIANVDTNTNSNTNIDTTNHNSANDTPLPTVPSQNIVFKDDGVVVNGTFFDKKLKIANCEILMDMNLSFNNNRHKKNNNIMYTFFFITISKKKLDTLKNKFDHIETFFNNKNFL